MESRRVFSWLNWKLVGSMNAFWGMIWRNLPRLPATTGLANGWARMPAVPTRANHWAKPFYRKMAGQSILQFCKSYVDQDYYHGAIDCSCGGTGTTILHRRNAMQQHVVALRSPVVFGEATLRGWLCKTEQVIQFLVVHTGWVGAARVCW